MEMDERSGDNTRRLTHHKFDLMHSLWTQVICTWSQIFLSVPSHDPMTLLGCLAPASWILPERRLAGGYPHRWPFLTYPLIYFCQVLGDFRFEDWLVSQVHRFLPQSAQERFIVCWLGRIKVRQTHRTCPSIRLCYEGQWKIYANTTCCLEKRHLKTINHEGGFDMKQTWTRVVKK
jgi:hypothetical protein